MKQPKSVEMSAEDQDEFVKRIQGSNLGGTDQEIVTGLIEFNKWLQFSLEEKSISISRLQKIFGSSSEKKSKKKKKKDKDESKEEPNDDNDTTTEEPPSEPVDAEEEKPTSNASNAKNSGRLSHVDYPNADIVPLEAPYNVGDPCPENCGGKLKRAQPGNVIKITGQSFAKATKYVVGKLRCNLCERYFSAELPEHVCPHKYDVSFKSHLCVYKHHLGVPNYRLEGYQKHIGVPLPDSTQFDKTEEVANDAFPVFKALERNAANAKLTYADDTPVKIQSVIKANKESSEKEKRKGTFTTGIVAYHNEHKIHLFYSGRKHAGENIKALIGKRDPKLPTMLYMCDGLPANVPKGLIALIINCLVHARRNFSEIEPYFPEECSYALEVFSTIYANEAKIKALKLNDEERLLYHRKHSRDCIKALYRWMLKQFKENQVEENSSLGKAFKYMLKRAKRLTRFLRVKGAPLDNNIVEQALKLAIRVRKNSLFYATEHGACIGSILQSVIHTCISAGMNPVAYLTALQENKSEVHASPDDWLPWNYLSTMKTVQLEAA